jgi:hypothetical protein
LERNYIADAQKLEKAKIGLVYVKTALEEIGENYWLAAGTLLGWYRGN